MKHIFVFDPDKCSACSACVMGCLDQNDMDLAAGERCFRQTFNNEVKVGNGETFCAYLSAACMHCEDAPCVAACPMGCITKDPETGFTVYDNTNCIGCKSCAHACPFGAPRFLANGKMVKCDGCNERVKAGMKPSCVRACSFGALTCVTEEEYAASGSDKACSKLIHQVKNR